VSIFFRFVMATVRVDGLSFVQDLMALARATLNTTQAATRNRGPFCEMAHDIGRALDTLEALGSRQVPVTAIETCTMLHQLRYALADVRDLCDQYEDLSAPVPIIFAEVYNAQMKRTLGALRTLAPALQASSESDGTLPPKLNQLAAEITKRPSVDYAKQYSCPGVVRSLVSELENNLPDSLDLVHVHALSGQWHQLDDLLREDRSFRVNDLGVHYAPLHVAVMYQDPYAVAMLLGHGAYIETSTRGAHLFPTGSTPLTIAVTLGNLPIVRLLLAWGAPAVTAVRVMTNSSCRTHLVDPTVLSRRTQEACGYAYRAQFGQFQRLMSKYEIPLHIKYKPDSKFFLIHQVAFGGNVDAYHLMLEAGASTLLRTTGHQLPSAVAAASGHGFAATVMERCQLAEQQLYPDPPNRPLPLQSRNFSSPTQKATQRSFSPANRVPLSPQLAGSPGSSGSPTRTRTPTRVIQHIESALDKAKQRLHRSPSPTKMSLRKPN
jgi:hypothetical protein